MKPAGTVKPRAVSERGPVVLVMELVFGLLFMTMASWGIGVLIEIIGVYCPICHDQESMLTKLYKRFRKTGLDKRITMLGIAAGGTSMEVRYLRKKNYIFPLVHDTEYEIYNAIGDTKTPFTMLVDKQGTVLFAHQGLLPDIGTFLKDIQALVQ